MQQLKIIGVSIFLEKSKTRMLAGSLVRVHGKFVFEYERSYFKAKNIIPLGPEFPLTQRSFESTELFPSLDDRIPSRENPAFREYCEALEIDPEERDPLVLLSTIGRKGPSSFVFHPKFDHMITGSDVAIFRKSLGFTTREFASVFDLTQASLNALERNRTSGKELLKRLELAIQFPSVAMYYLLINGGSVVGRKVEQATKTLNKLR